MSTLDKSRKTVRAAELLELGLRTSIVAQETGLTAEAVRQIHREVNQASPKSGQLPDIESLLKTKRSQIEAVLLFAIYSRLIQKSHNKLNLQQLQKAYCFYQELRSELKLTNTSWKNFTINEAWVLIRAFVTQQVSRSWCQCGGCSLQLRDRQKIKCPFCGQKQTDA